MTQQSAPILVWFRQDLRLDDNPAFAAAAATGRPVVPVYILDDLAPGQWRLGGASRWWLHHSLAALAETLAGHALALVLRAGEAAAGFAGAGGGNRRRRRVLEPLLRAAHGPARCRAQVPASRRRRRGALLQRGAAFGAMGSKHRFRRSFPGVHAIPKSAARPPRESSSRPLRSARRRGSAAYTVARKRQAGGLEAPAG